MRNVDLQGVRTASLGLAPGEAVIPRCARICEANGVPLLYALVRSEATGALTLRCAALDPGARAPWSAVDLSPHLSSPGDVGVALDVDAAGLDPVVVALRGGSLLSVDAESGEVELVGEVVDEDGDEGKGGVLALGKSPDGALIVVVSPVKIILMTSAWELVGEVEVVGDGGEACLAMEASLSWRGDGAHFVVSMRDASGAPYARVLDRDGEDVIRVEVEEVLRGAGGDCAVLGGPVAWQPRVGGIVCLAGPGRALTAFERNGKRHLRNDFLLQSDGNEDVCGLPRMLEWSCDSALLAVVTNCGTQEQVDVYMRSNYRWYRKQCLRQPAGVTIADARWDVENRSVVHVLTAGGVLTTYSLRSSHVGAVSSGAVVSVVDGSELLVTDLTKAMIPPPMCQRTLVAPDAIVAVVLGNQELSSQSGVLLANGHVALLSSGDGVVAASSREVRLWHVSGDGKKSGLGVRFPVMVSASLMAVVDTEGVASSENVALHVLPAERRESQCIVRCECPGRVQAMALASASCAAESLDCVLIAAVSTGSFVRMAVRGAADTPHVSSLEVVDRIECDAASHALSVAEISVVCGNTSYRVAFVHDDAGCLEAIDVSSRTVVKLSSECTSFCISRRHVAFTTRSHVLYCIPILSPSMLVSVDEKPSSSPAVASLMSRMGTEAERLDSAARSSQPPSTSAGMVRPIDRGSVVVCSLPSDVRIVLQALRGNIETIAPRPLVLAEVWQLASSKKYGAAFRLSRQQRIDMNVMVDANPNEFLDNIPLLIEEVPFASHLSVFLTYLRGDHDRINAVCDGVVRVIDGLDDRDRAARLTTTALTALVVRKPPLFGQALSRVQKSYRRSEEEGASALDFLLVLSKNEEMLYNESLGTYDLKLAVMVAKASQLDPVDYSTELRTLREMSEQRRRYTIDLKLERYGQALCNLFECGPEERGTCLNLARERALYAVALKLFTDDTEACSQLRTWYAEHLISLGKHADAAVVYVANGNFISAARAYRDAGDWRLALSSFSKAQGGPNLVSPGGEGDAAAHAWRVFAETVADSLTERGDAVHAASVRWGMLRDLDGALDELLPAQEWLVAFETVAAVAAMSSSTNVAVDDYIPAVAAEIGRHRVMSELEEAADTHVADLKDNAAKLRERANRLGAVRETKERMREALGVPGGDGGGEGDADSDAFSASTGASSQGSFGSDMTFASSTSTARTQTSLYHSIGRGSGGVKELAAEKRRQGKAVRKRVRTGHPREEEALVATLTRLVPNAFLRARIGKTITALAHCGKYSLASSLSGAMSEVLSRCRDLPGDLLETETVQEALADGSWHLLVLNVLEGGWAR
jgi:IKI3 family